MMDIQSHKSVDDYHPIFILGALQRTGTNYLCNLLTLHPQCTAVPPIWEDYFVHHISLLNQYAEILCNQWNLKDPEKKNQFDEFCAGLGNGIVSFLAKKSKQKRAITKTPSVFNLEYFSLFFPEAYLIIITRDGRSVVESGHISFGWDYDIATKRWAEASRTIQLFQESHKDLQNKYVIVRYEDIFNNMEQEMRRILSFLNLDMRVYDMDAARSIPIHGTSELIKGGQKSLHWDAVNKYPDFDPLHRWKTWGRYRHERFNSIALKYLANFGYQPKIFSSHTFIWKIFNQILNIRLSLLWHLRALKRSAIIIHKH